MIYGVRFLDEAVNALSEKIYVACSKYPRLQRVITAGTVADKLWWPWHYIAGSPRGAIVVVLVAYVVVLIFWFPLWVLSQLITEGGTWLALIGGIFYTGRQLARYLSYPGCFATVIRDIEKDYSRRLVQKLDATSAALWEWGQDLRDRSNVVDGSETQNMLFMQMGVSNTPFAGMMTGSGNGGFSRFPDQREFIRRHAEVMYLKKEVLEVLRDALELVGCSGSSTVAAEAAVVPASHDVDNEGDEETGRSESRDGSTTASISGGGLMTAAAMAADPPLVLSEHAASVACVLQQTLREAIVVVEKLEGRAERLARANSHEFRALHAKLCGPTGPSAGAVGGDAHFAPSAHIRKQQSQNTIQEPTHQQLIEQLMVCLGRLRILCPKLRLRASKDEEGVLGLPRSWLNARKPVDSVVCLSLMRAEVIARFNAECFPLELPGRKIDVCVVPCPPDNLLAARRRYFEGRSLTPKSDAVSNSSSRSNKTSSDETASGGGNCGGTSRSMLSKQVELTDVSRVEKQSIGNVSGQDGESSANSFDTDYSKALFDVNSLTHVQEGVPAVVFCNPNAGLYECANMSPKSSDWLQFYHRLGFQVVLFNYRGYGRSTGVPSPHDNAKDAKELVLHLHRHCRVPRIVMHGESIGGMAAAFSANELPGMVDFLIVDRTFCNLGAVAQYLVGGWTRPGLAIFTCWNTDVRENYLNSTCPKVLCSDVDDEIIAEPGSLKAGIAVSLEFGDEQCVRPTLPFEYAVAEAIDVSPPPFGSNSRSREESLASSLSPPPSLSAFLPRAFEETSRASAEDGIQVGSSGGSSFFDKLSEAHVVHFSQCLRRIAKRARAIERLSKRGNATHGDDSGNSAVLSSAAGLRGRPTNVDDATYSTKSAMQGSGSWKLATLAGGSANSSPGSPPSVSEAGGGLIDDAELDDVEGGSSAVACMDHETDDGIEPDESGDGTEWSWAFENGPKNDQQYADDRGNESLGVQSPHSSPRHNDSSTQSHKHPNDPNCNPWLDGGQMLHPLQRVWWLAARCDGRCGQLLGHAAARGLPWVRAWIASLVVWKGAERVTEISRCDPYLDDPRCLSVSQVSEELDRIFSQVESSATLGDSSPSSSASSSSSSGSSGSGSACSVEISQTDLQEVFFVAGMFRYLASRLRISAGQAETDTSLKNRLGSLIPLHCGHNAPYSEEEQTMLIYHIEKTIRSWNVHQSERNEAERIK